MKHSSYTNTHKHTVDLIQNSALGHEVFDRMPSFSCVWNKKCSSLILMIPTAISQMYDDTRIR